MQHIGNKCNLLQPRFNHFGCRYLNRIILGIRHCRQQACVQDGIPCKLACIGMGRYDEGMKSFCYIYIYKEIAHKKSLMIVYVAGKWGTTKIHHKIDKCI